MKKQASIKFRNSLLGKMLLFGVVPTILILSAIIIFTSTQNYATTLKANENLLKSIADKISKEIEGGNRRSIIVAETMARAQENGLFGNRIASIAYMRKILETFQEFTGIGLGYEPNADQNDQAYLQSKEAKSIPPNALNKKGRFLPYWYRGKTEADKHKIYMSTLLDMETSLYYQGK